MGHNTLQQILIDWILQRCEGGRDLLVLEDCVQAEAHSLEKYLSNSK